MRLAGQHNILSETNPVCLPTPLLVIQFQYYPPVSTSEFQVNCLVKVSHQIPVPTSAVPYTFYMPHSSHSSRLNDVNNIYWKLWIVKFLSMLSSTLPWYILLGPYIFNTSFPHTLSLCSSSSVSDQVSHPYEIAGNIVFKFVFLESVLNCEQIITFLWKCLTPDIKSVCVFKTSLHIYHSGRGNISQRLTLRKAILKMILLLCFDIKFALLLKMLG
jgi:hypothetical protein